VFARNNSCSIWIGKAKMVETIETETIFTGKFSPLIHQPGCTSPGVIWLASINESWLLFAWHGRLTHFKCSRSYRNPRIFHANNMSGLDDFKPFGQMLKLFEVFVDLRMKLIPHLQLNMLNFEQQINHKTNCASSHIITYTLIISLMYITHILFYSILFYSILIIVHFILF
jgi:hypothetical protein